MSNLCKKILVVNDWGPTYFLPFDHLGLECTRDHSAIDNPEDIALVVFTGGEDVSPGLYNKSVHPRTHASLERDVEETAIFNKAMGRGIPMAGICRGSQFLCVMSGGRLVQDVTGHCRSHALVATYPDGTTRPVLVTSSHHQMQYPFDMANGTDFQILAWTPNPISQHYAFDAETTITKENATRELLLEPDVVWYPGTKALAAQYHPEWMEGDSEGLNYFRTLVDHYLVPLMETDGTDQARKTSA